MRMLLLVLAVVVLCGCGGGGGGGSIGTPAIPIATPSQVRAFCVDFNWLNGSFAPAGTWADADPAAHFAWYQSAGCNVIQTFGVSANGYAWYHGGTIPEQPGLAHDFLPEMVRLGHAANMQTMAYYCVGANARWSAQHPDQSYQSTYSPSIVLTDEYLRFLANEVREGLSLSGADGIMLDWVWCPFRTARDLRGGKWLDSEKRLYQQLVGKPFPGEANITPAEYADYERRAIDRAWSAVRNAVRSVNASAILWPCVYDLTNPSVIGSRMLAEADWLMDETGRIGNLRGVSTSAYRIQCLYGSYNDDAALLSDPANAGYGVYGFYQPQSANNSLPPPVTWFCSNSGFTGNDASVAAILRYYATQP